MKAYVIKVPVDIMFLADMWQTGAIRAETHVIDGLPEGAELRKVELADSLTTVFFYFIIPGEHEPYELMEVVEKKIQLYSPHRKSWCRDAWDAGTEVEGSLYLAEDDKAFEEWWKKAEAKLESDKDGIRKTS